LRPFQSTASVAIALFLTINGCISLSAMLARSSTKNQDQNGVLRTIDTAVQQYSQSVRPDVVLLGSSLIMSPVWTADFHKFGFPAVADFYRHHHYKMLEQALTSKGEATKQVFSFAVPGAMISDMYLVVDKLLKGDKAPPVVVYGVAPRDFMDDLASGETKTAVFSRLGDVGDLNRSNYVNASFDEKFELLLDRGIYLYGKRVRYQTKADLFVRKVAMKASAQKGGVDPFATTADVFPLFQDRKILWQHSVDEYRMRYQKFNAAQYATQQRFLQDLLTTCHDRKIQVLLVNMPLTEENRKLMQPGLYKSYLDNLQAVATNNAVPLLDLSKEQFPDQCFYDTVHLNEAGAKLFQAQLQKVLRANADGRMTASLPKQSL